MGNIHPLEMWAGGVKSWIVVCAKEDLDLRIFTLHRQLTDLRKKELPVAAQHSASIASQMIVRTSH